MNARASSLSLPALAVLAAACAAQDLPRTPRVLWHAGGASFRTDLPVRGDRVWIGGRHLRALDVRTGAEVARAAQEGPWMQPVLGGGLVFARHQEGSLHALTLDLDRELWRLGLARAWHAGTAHGDMYFVTAESEVLAITGGKVHWRVDLGSPVAMQPATCGRRVFVAAKEGVVVALAVADGDEIWRRETGAEFGWSDPVVDRGVLFLADRGVQGGRKAACNAFDASTGELLWSTEFGATGFSRPHPSGDSVWAGFGVSVAAFDRRTGALDLAHRVKTGRNPFGLPGVAGDALVFGNLDGHLYVHDLASRALRWKFQAGQGDSVQVGAWALHDGVLLVGTTVGLFAIGDTPGAEPAAPGFVLRAAQR